MKVKRYYEPVKSGASVKTPERIAKMEEIAGRMIKREESTENGPTGPQKCFGFGRLVNTVESIRDYGGGFELSREKAIDAFWSILLGFAEDAEDYMKQKIKEAGIEIDDPDDLFEPIDELENGDE